MKLGEKLQQLRKKSGLSQEQLAAQLTVSRQAVSKWELDDAMPDTENVIQLSRIFGVSCDYLLLEEVDEQGAPLPAPDAPQPTPPGETHLSEQGWVHNAFALSLAACAIGLLLALGGWLHEQTSGPLIIGLIIQILGVMLFELAVPRMGGDHTIIRLKFYKLAVWLLMPIPMYGASWWMFDFAVRPYPSVFAFSSYISLDFSFSGVLTAVLAVKQQRLQRQARKN